MLAFVMGQHPRMGQHSQSRVVGSDVAQTIFERYNDSLEEDMNIIQRELALFFPDRDALDAIFSKQADEEKITMIADLLLCRGGEPRDHLLSGRLIHTKQQFRALADTTTTTATDHDDLPAYEPLAALVKRLCRERQMHCTIKDNRFDEHFWGRPTRLQLGPGCSLYKMTEDSVCSCTHYDMSTVDESHAVYYKGFDFRYGHILFVDEFDEYMRCTVQCLKDHCTSKEACAPWLAEMLVMQACAVFREEDAPEKDVQVGIFFDRSRHPTQKMTSLPNTKQVMRDLSYSHSEDTFILTAWIYVCMKDTGDSYNPLGRCYSQMVFDLKISRDGRLVKIKHSWWPGDSDSEGCGCKVCCSSKNQQTVA